MWTTFLRPGHVSQPGESFFFETTLSFSFKLKLNLVMLAIPVRVPWLRSTPPADCRGKWTSCFSLRFAFAFHIFCLHLHSILWSSWNLSRIRFLMDERRESATSLTETEFRRGATASPSEWAIWSEDCRSGSEIKYQDRGSRIGGWGSGVRIVVNHHDPNQESNQHQYDLQGIGDTEQARELFSKTDLPIENTIDNSHKVNEIVKCKCQTNTKIWGMTNSRKDTNKGKEIPIKGKKYQ